MADNVSIFLAGNRKLNKTDLENTLVAGIEPYIETYLGTWGKENTQAVRLAYSQLINAIHDDKVSMNIDGSLHVSDGSIYNSPDKKGFDPVAKAAYFVTSIINRMSDYKEPEKEVKKYGTDLFAKNFVNYLAPPNSGVDISNLWANLDDEVEDDKGNRSRPYTNRLAYFNKFLDLEIANLNNYDEVDEYWGGKDAFRNQLIDLRLRLSDNDISKEDTMMLAKLGLGPSFFDTTGTSLTEEELLKREELRLADEAKLKEEQAKKAAQIQANRGILGREVEVYGRDAANNKAAYEQYLADTYGTGEAGFNAINNKILALLEKASDDNSNLSATEKRQLGNFITYIKQNNPAYLNQQLDPIERAELKTHGNFGNRDVIRLPWTTKNGRYVYADDMGYVYFLKPNNQVKFDYKYGVTDDNYKKNFLKHVPTPENEEYNRQLAGQRIVSEDLRTEDIVRFGAIAEDIGAFVASFAPGYGTAASGVLSIGSLITDAIADKIDPSVSTGEWWKNLGINLGAGILGLIPGGKSAGLVRKALKYAPMVYGAYQSGRIAYDKEVWNSFKKLMSSGAENKLTVNDWKNIGAGFTALATAGMIGNRAYKLHNYNKLRGTSETTYDIKTKTATNGETKNTTHNITKELRALINEAGKKGGLKAANEKLLEVTKDKNVELAEGKFAAEAPGRIKRAAQVLTGILEVKGTAKTTVTGTNHPTAQKVAAKNQELVEKHPTLSKWMSTNYDIFVNGKAPVTIKRPEWTKPWWERGESIESAKSTTSQLSTGTAAKVSSAETLAVLNRLRSLKTELSTNPVRNGGYRIAGKELKVQTGADNSKIITFGKEKVEIKSVDGKVADSKVKLEVLKLLRKHSANVLHKLRKEKSEVKLDINLKDLANLANLGFLKEGGQIPKFLGGGGVSYNDMSYWKRDVFSPYLEHLLRQLKNSSDRKYARWVNHMLDWHSDLHTKAGENFLNTPWSNQSVRLYQMEYGNDPYATGERLNWGYNYGIDNALKDPVNRYIVASKNPNSGDWQKQGYKADGLFSGITDDRRILGRKGDFTESEFAELNRRLKESGNYFAYLDKNGYYKLGFYDENGNKKMFTKEGEIDFVPQDVNEQQQSGISLLNPLVNPKIKAPEKIDVLSDIRRRQGIWGEGTEINKNKLDVDDLVQKGLINGLATGSLLGTIATNNKNFELLRKARRRVNLDDYPQEYYAYTGDYAGNQVANNQAAEVEKVANTPKTSNAALNAALALEGVIKARNIRQQQAVRDLDHRQQRQSLIEQTANKNQALRIATANKNAETLYNIEQQIASDEQDKNLGNWTSINNFINQGIYDAKTEYATRRQIKDAWAANLLGTRQDYIRQALNMDGELQKLREEFKKDQNNAELASKIRNLTSERIYTYGTLWDLLYAQQYGLQYNGPRYTPWDMFQRYGILYARGGKLTPEEVYIREDNRNRRANADRFMKTIWKAIDVYLKQKNSK